MCPSEQRTLLADIGIKAQPRCKSIVFESRESCARKDHHRVHTARRRAPELSTPPQQYLPRLMFVSQCVLFSKVVCILKAFSCAAMSYSIITLDTCN